MYFKGFKDDSGYNTSTQNFVILDLCKSNCLVRKFYIHCYRFNTHYTVIVFS